MFRLKVYSIFLSAVATAVVAGTGVTLSAPAGTPVALTADQDRQRLLDLLHITSMRPGADGFNPKAPNAANYDEAKAEATPFKLPDPLKLKDGTPVTSTDMWWQQRRGEIADDFDKEVYGHLPSVTVGVQWKVVDSVPETVGTIKAITKHVVGHVVSKDPSLSFDFPLTITLPAEAKKPVPVVLQLLPASFAQYLKSSNWRQMLLKKGWGAAVLDVNAVQADSGEGLVKGVIGVSTGGKPRDIGDWGVLRAWGWGASRAMDYFETDAAIDSAHVGIEGLSRYGKAALVAMAYDPRFVVGFIASSGAGGAKLFRRNFGENEGNLTAGGEYQWFAGNFLKYDGPLAMNDLPVDAHELIALCAPRPVFISARLQRR